jgi:hypothetical protein
VHLREPKPQAEVKRPPRRPRVSPADTGQRWQSLAGPESGAVGLSEPPGVGPGPAPAGGSSSQDPGELRLPVPA